MRKIKLISVIVFISVLFISSANRTGMAQLDEEITWDYSGFIDKQNDRRYFNENSDYKLRYYYHIFTNPETESVEAIVAIYGLRPLLNAPEYSTFFDEAATGSSYYYWLNETAGLDWVGITYDMVANNASDNYAPEYLEAYNAITGDTLLSIRNDIWDTEGNLLYPINFANLTEAVGEVGMWKIERKDGTIIQGKFTTYGENNPIYVDEEVNYLWPEYNIAVAQNTFRSAVPGEHSIGVNFPFTAIIIFGLIYGTFVMMKRLKRRNN